MFSKLFPHLPWGLALALSLSLAPAFALTPEPEQDAYGLGMGDAVAAIAGGTQAIEWNPAGIARATVPMAQMGLGLTPGSLDLQFNTSVLYPFQDGTVFGLSQYSNFPNVPGSFTTYIGTVGLPLNSSRDFLLGINLKYIALGSGSGINVQDGRGLGLDLGLSYDLREPQGTVASFGLVVKNLDTEIRFNNTNEEPLDRTFTLAAAYQGFQDTRVEMDYDILDQTLQSSNSHSRLRLGAERFFNQRIFSARVGIDDLFNSDSYFSMGGGYHPAEPFELSYAFRVSANTGEFTHSLSFVYRFDRLFSQEKAEEKPEEKPQVSSEINLGSLDELTEATPSVGKPVSSVLPRKMTIQVSPKAFSPGRGKTMALSFPGDNVPGISRWLLEFFDSNGKTLRRIGGTGPLVPEIAWDGFDNDGKYLPDGKYRLDLKTFGPGNNLLSDDSQEFQILTPRSGLGLETANPYFSALAGGKGKRAIVLAVEDGGNPAVQSWGFEVHEAATSKLVFALRGKLKLPKVIRWNGKTPKGINLADGTYECLLTAQDAAGNISKADPLEVTLDNTPPEAALAGESRLADFVSGGSFKFLPTAEDKGGLKAWTLDVLNEKGGVSKAFTGDGQPPSSLVWDGKNDDGSVADPGSLLKAFLLAEDKAGNKTQSPPYWLQVDADLKGQGEQMTLSLATVTFNQDSSILDLKGQAALKKASASIRPYLDKSVLVIKGYASPGGKKDLVLLSRQRALEVKKFLVKTLGIQPDGVFALGYADQDTVAGNAAAPGESGGPDRAVVTLTTKP